MNDGNGITRSGESWADSAWTSGNDLVCDEYRLAVLSPSTDLPRSQTDQTVVRRSFAFEAQRRLQATRPGDRMRHAQSRSSWARTQSSAPAGCCAAPSPPTGWESDPARAARVGKNHIARIIRGRHPRPLRQPQSVLAGVKELRAEGWRPRASGSVAMACAAFVQFDECIAFNSAQAGRPAAWVEERHGHPIGATHRKNRLLRGEQGVG